MSQPVVLFLSAGGFRAAWQSMSVALTAQAMGDQVTVVVGFDALEALAARAFGRPASEPERAMAARGEQMGAARPQGLLEEARALGARLVACDTTVRLCGLVGADLVAAGVLDEVLGLPEIWRRSQAAKVLSFS